MKCIPTVFLLILSAALSAQEASLVLTSDIWPPFTNEKGKNSFALDLVNEALNRRGISAETRILEFRDILDGLKSDQFDGSGALWHTEERAKYLLYSDPYLHNQLVLVGRKGSKVDAKSFEELASKKIAVVQNYAYGSMVEGAENIEFVDGASDQENLTKLLSKDVDYMLVDALLIQYLLNHQKEEAIQYLEIASEPLFKRSLHFAVRKNLPNAQGIIRGFNEEIILMIADGSYNKILNLNWIRADIDGDGQMEMVLNGKNAGNKAPVTSYSVFFDTKENKSRSEQYYIEGNFYQSWDKIPSEYKQPEIQSQDLGKIGALSFKF